ncbi:MAG: AraC family transcriptional regulator [Verrucomicrobiota bacterium]
MINEGSLAVREVTNERKQFHSKSIPFSAILQVSSGRSLFWINGNLVKVKKGDFLMISKGASMTHLGETGHNCGVEYLIFFGPLSYRIEFLLSGGVYFSEKSKHATGLLVEKLDKAIKCCFAERSDSFYLADCLLSLFSQVEGQLPKSRNDDIRSRALRVIRKKPSQNWTVKDLSDELGVSISLLAHQAKDIYRETPGLWIRQERCRLAATYLGQGYTVAETAEILNFSTPYHFSRCFRSVMGQNPKDFKKSS